MTETLAAKKFTKTADKTPKHSKTEHPKYVSYDNIDKVGEVALFYGFTPIAEPHIHPDDSASAKEISEGEIVVDKDDHEEGATLRLEEKISLIRLYEKEKLGSQPQPIMLFYRKPFIGDRRKPNPHESHYGLEIIGSNKSIADAILMQTAIAILRDAGEKDLHIDINSIGDKESLSRFTREVTSYYKKHLAELPQKCRETFKKDVFSLLGCEHETCQKLALECPKAVNFLSEKSRLHFKEVLEYLESLQIPYTIDNSLVANRDYCDETVFEIRRSDPKAHPLAIGIRYDTLARRLGAKRDLPAVGVSIALPRKSTKSEILTKSKVAKIANPEICFMQLGNEAKQKSLGLIETLRQARIPVIQSLAKDKMAGQVGMAEKYQTPVVIIMGKKEAMENSVIMRETATRSQDSVSLGEIASRLKKYRI